jgi:hypothetical protein
MTMGGMADIYHQLAYLAHIKQSTRTPRLPRV